MRESQPFLSTVPTTAERGRPRRARAGERHAGHLVAIYEPTGGELGAGALAPNVWVTYDLLGYEAKGNLFDAAAQFPEGVRNRANHYRAARVFGASLGASEEISGGAGKVLQQLKELSSRQPRSAVNVAWIYAALGETDQALAMLKKAYDEQCWYIVLLAVDPLRPTPRRSGRRGKLG